jgi:hypothetical protein
MERRKRAAVELVSVMRPRLGSAPPGIGPALDGSACGLPVGE